MLAMMRSKRTGSFWVLPGPPGNSVSPENRCPPYTKHVDPGVCPGVWIACSACGPNEKHC